MAEFRGVAHCFGDNVNTDYIISSRRKRDTIDPAALTPYIMEDIRPEFAALPLAGSMLVGGESFGCGSAMEVAAQVVAAAGIRVILAKSFARSYYRNAVNNGILPVELDTAFIAEGDPLCVGVSPEAISVENLRTGERRCCPPVKGVAGALLAAGGIIPYVKALLESGEENKAITVK